MIRRKKIMYEEDLHEVFYRYPYLIVNEPNSIIKTIHEYELDSNSIPDIYIETKTKKYYCEVKIGKLKEKDLYQAIRYFNTSQVLTKNHENIKFSVILIGMNISNQLKEKATKKGIKTMIIGKDIPESIKICKKCRKAFDFIKKHCSFCNSSEILEIINLKYP